MTRYYEILRENGVKQYYRRTSNDQFAPIGGGFVINVFDCVLATEVDFVPSYFAKGVTYFSDDYYEDFDEAMLFEAYVDKNQRWNGWSIPYVLVSQMSAFVDYLNVAYDKGDEQFIYNVSEGSVTFLDVDGDGPYIMEQEEINGEMCIQFNIGYCFDFMTNEQLKNKKKELAEDEY